MMMRHSVSFADSMQQSNLSFQTSLNYERIINKQQTIIQGLKQQITLLKNLITKSQHSYICKLVHAQSLAQKKISLSQGTIKNISNLLGIPVEGKNNLSQQILNQIKILKQKVNTRPQHIIIQKMKEVQVPFPIQKIVYRESRYEQPIFKPQHKINFHQHLQTSFPRQKPKFKNHEREERDEYRQKTYVAKKKLN